jgi:hypothetical protein
MTEKEWWDEVQEEAAKLIPVDSEGNVDYGKPESVPSPLGVTYAGPAIRYVLQAALLKIRREIQDALHTGPDGDG